MRKNIVSILLLGLVGGLAFFLFMRRDALSTEQAHVSTSDTTVPSDREGAGGESGAGAAGTKTGSTSSGATNANPSDPGAANTPQAPPEPLLDRPLRVVSKEWHLLAPALLGEAEASTTHAAFGGAPLDVRVRSGVRARELSAALARGGASEDGADLAVVELQDFVGEFEDLSALSPKMVFLAGWSHGAHVITTSGRDTSLSVRPSAVTAKPGTAEFFLAAWALEKAGVDIQSVTFDESSATLSARRLLRERDASERVLLSTAEARLIPYVIVAPSGLVDSHPRAIQAFLAGWLSGVERLKSDVPGSARSIAALPDAPEAVALVRSLGRVSFADLRENATRLGLTGRHAATLPFLFSETWRVGRKMRTITSPIPAAPVDASFVTSLALRRSLDDDTVAARSHSFDGDVLLTTSLDAATEALVIERTVGELADVFESSPIRLRIKRGRRMPDPEAVLTAVSQRYGIERSRLEANQRPPRGSSIAIDVLRAE